MSSRRAGGATKWRNQHCTVDTIASSALTSMGTELDWMRFFLAWNTVGTNKPSLDEIADVYIQACGGTLCDTSKVITFEGSDGTASLNDAVLNELAAGDRSNAKYVNFRNQGRAFGVEGDTTP